MIQLPCRHGENRFCVFQTWYWRDIREQDPRWISQAHELVNEASMFLVKNRISAFVVKKCSSIEYNKSKGLRMPPKAY